MDGVTIALATASFLLGGFVKGAIGLGMPVVVIVGLALVMPLKSAIAVFLLPGVVSNIWQMTYGPHLPQLIRRLWTFLLGAILGTMIGASILAGAQSESLLILLGVLLILYSSYALSGPRLPTPGPREIWMSPAAGGTGGLMFGMTGIFIVPGLLYLETLRLPRDAFIQALGLCFVTLTATMALSLTGLQVMTWELALLSLFAVAPATLGIWLGVRLRRRIAEDFYRKLFFAALIVAGIYFSARGAGLFS